MTIWQCRDGLVVYENYSLGTLEHNQLQGIYMDVTSKHDTLISFVASSKLSI